MHGTTTIYKQLQGISMGITCANIIANVYVGSLLGPVFDSFNKDNNNAVLQRGGYVDDIYAQVDTDAHGITQLLTNLNNAHPTLALSGDHNLHSINYMDMTISKGQRWTAHPHLLDVKLFEKSASKHLYIPYTSNHPKKTLTGFIYGEARRIICLSSSQQDALNASRNFADSERLQARGYPLHVIIKQLQKADYNSRHDYIFSSPKASSTNTNQLRVNPTNSTGGNNATNTSNNTNARTVTCVLPYSKFSQDLQLQRVASAALDRYNNNTSHVALEDSNSMVQRTEPPTTTQAALAQDSNKDRGEDFHVRLGR